MAKNIRGFLENLSDNFLNIIVILPNSLLSLLFTSLIVWKISKTDKVSDLHVQRKKIRPYKIQSVTDD